MRSLSTLYSIAYGRIMWAKDGDFNSMCHLISTLANDRLISIYEWERLTTDLSKNRPTEYKHLDFASLKEYDWDDAYWFPKGELKYRKLFLYKMINYSKPWYTKLYLLWKGKLTEKILPDT